MNERDKKRCEGVAGQIFFDGIHAVEDLPAVDGEGDRAELVKEYARRTFDTEDAVKREIYYARSIGGTHVLVNGERWGIIVLDSPDPHAVTDSRLHNASYTRLARAVTRLLEGGPK